MKTIDPEMMAAIKEHKELQQADGGVPDTLVENRRQQNRLAPHWSDGAPAVAKVLDRTIRFNGEETDIRIYQPHAAKPDAVILFLHGGGWARGTISTGDWACHTFAAETNLTVVSLAYSLAPEAPFPAAINDIRAAMDWSAEHGAELGFNGRRVFLTGTSAGGNLSLAAALARRDHGEFMPIGCGLLFGVFGDNLETDSYNAYGPGQYGLSYARMKQYFEWYVPEGVSSREPLISPLYADLSGLPATFVGIAEFDVLRDDSFLLAGKLAATATPLTVRYYEGLAHGYAMFAKGVPAARRALSDTAAFFRDVASGGCNAEHELQR
ncbi:alpha/beta hydrolase [Mesorhizobium sp. VK23B]|uniref:Alpha/beta hydrolase n=1 Tax=Mesorhizobium dulcispinae TaxID=3072316 RepID=A0ABU4XP65_9HYPH|nr:MULTISPECIES: alpha/beta hydrolase [unclassified Mesorhizobium]MDX8470173.1 alpha/beta hydrolase [Mesorhizobium sp. VK23B]MDX8476551.1 alpha/beta hydrolase [Mesorhizobium sp. VK23A]